jgi:hypothetical protein
LVPAFFETVRENGLHVQNPFASFGVKNDAAKNIIDVVQQAEPKLDKFFKIVLEVNDDSEESDNQAY